MIQNSYGEHKRTNARKKKDKLIKKQIEALMSQTVTCLELDDYKSKTFLVQQDEFLKKVQETYTSQYFVYAYNLVVKTHNSNIKLKNWKATQLQILTPERIESHFRSDIWFFKFNELSQWMKLWESYLSKKPKSTTNDNEILSSIAISAICHGGLNSPHAIVSLLNTLANETRPLNFGDHYWIDLKIFERGFDRNYEIDNQKVHIKRWYPDNMTLMWINNFLNNAKFNKVTFDVDLTTNILFSWMSLIIKKVKSDFKFNAIKSLKDLCDAGAGILESTDGTYINQALIGYAKGEIKSSSLSPNFFNNVLTNNFPKLDKPYQATRSIEQKKNTNVFLSTLTRLLTSKKESKKVHKTEVVAKIINLDFSTLAEYLLLSWVFYHLDSMNHALSTLYNYVSTIGYNWLEITDETFNNHEELEGQYEEMLDNASTYYYGRLKDIHEYAIKLNEIEEVSIFEDRFLKDTVVSTGFLTEKFFFDFISDLINSNDRFVRKDMYLVLYIIAFRTGFRLSELLKIRIRDIEITTNEIWLLVRVNQYGNHKTKSAKRKFPLSIFLTKSENKLVHKYIEIKKIKPNVVNSTPLFSFDFNPNYGLTKTPINRITRKYITEKYITRITLHTFRHTALSRLHFILSNNDYLIEKLTNYDNKQILVIQNFFNSKGKNTFWNIAALAGHNTPFTTFSSYLHFTDFLLYSSLKDNAKTVNYNYFLNSSGCNYQYLTSRILHNPSIQKNKIPIIETSTILNSSLANYVNKIKVNTNTDYDLGNLLNQDNENYLQPQDCYHILRLLEKNQPIDKLARKLKISSKIIEKWLANAQEISSYKTQLNVARHFKKNRRDNKTRLCLAPSSPQSHTEIMESENIADNYHNLWKKHPQQFKNSLMHFLHHSLSSRPGIAFKTTESLDDFLTLLSHYYKKSRIRISLNLTESKTKSLTIYSQNNLWKQAINNRATTVRSKNFKSTKYPIGKATLSIKHSKEKSIKKKRKFKKTKLSSYHTTSIKFIFHILAILHLDELKQY